MTYYKPPMLLDALRLTGNNVDETVSSLTEYYSHQSSNFNYQRAVRFLRYGYDGAADVPALVKSCYGDGRLAFKENAKVLEASLPRVIGRRTKTFSYPPRRLTVTPMIQCSIGPACFITEVGVVKLVYVHARNNNRASLGNLAEFATIAKADILDNDFYGEPGDLEIHLVDKKGSARTDEVWNLTNIQRHLDRDPNVALSIFAQAFKIVDDGRLAGAPRPAKSKEKAESDSEPELDLNPIGK